MRVPAFGDVITAKTKETPADAFAPRGRDVHFLGALDHVTHGVLTGTYDGRDWSLECSANFVLHDPVINQEEPAEEETVVDNVPEAKKDEGTNVTDVTGRRPNRSQAQSHPPSGATTSSVPEHVDDQTVAEHDIQG